MPSALRLVCSGCDAVSLILKVFGLVCVAVGCLHIVLGLGAEQLLGAELSAETLSNASLDSQNRFYGAQFMLVGAVSWICATDLDRHATLFRVTMVVFFLGGVARLVSLASHGWPSEMVQLLGLSELVIPPLLIVWHAAILKRNASA